MSASIPGGTILSNTADITSNTTDTNPENNISTASITIAKAQTSTNLSPPANPSLVGQPATFVATVSSTSPARPTGTVTFLDGAIQLGTANLPATGPDQASLTTSSLSPGTHSVTAMYNGDPSFLSSSSAPLQAVGTFSLS